MRQAVEMIESQPGLCDCEQKYAKDMRRLQQESGHLKEALRRALERLALWGDDTFLQELQSESCASSSQVSEGDLARMKLQSVGQELAKLRAENAALKAQQESRDQQLARQSRRVESLEAELKEARSAMPVDPVQVFQAIDREMRPKIKKLSVFKVPPPRSAPSAEWPERRASSLSRISR
ncbi:unnamed protein product [Effrenium voratum]|nr:unnamed protein product [Effrenium voratum]